MKASELIKELEKQISDHGDCELQILTFNELEGRYQNLDNMILNPIPATME